MWIDAGAGSRHGGVSGHHQGASVMSWRYWTTGVVAGALAFWPVLNAEAATHGLVYVKSAPFGVNPYGDIPYGEPKCPKDTFVTGGGLSIVEGDRALMVLHTYPTDGGDPDSKPDDKWFGMASNTSTTFYPGGGQTTVICSTTGVFKYRQSAEVDLPPNTQGHAEAHCPTGARAIGGGMKGEGWLGQGLSSSYPLDTSRDADDIADDAWQVWATNERDLDGSVTAYVICATENKSSYKYLAGDPSTISTGSQGTATVACGPGSSVVGGGGYLTGLHPSIEMLASYPEDDLSDANAAPDDVWIVRGNNDSGDSQSLTAWAVCRT